MATKAERRAHGTGSIRPLPDGGYQVSIEAGWTQRGTRRRIRRNVKATGREGEREAKVLLRQLLREIAPAEDVRQGITVKAWSDRWLTITETKHRPATWATNRSSIRKWIVPTIGHRRLDKLAPTDVRAVTRAILDAGLSSSTAQRTHILLIKILRDALVDGHQVAARLLEMEAPGRAESGRDAIPLIDALAILAAASTRPDASRWVAALLQGMRPAECRGLTWACIDLDADEIDISWQLKALPYKEARDPASGFRIPAGYTVRHLVDAYHLVRPKSKAGKRIVPIVPWMHQALTQWLLDAPRNPHDLVWPGKFGRPLNDVDDRESWRALCKMAGVADYDLYEARHTTATLLLEAGVDMEIIKSILGHATILSTKSYAHVQTDTTRRALSDLATRLGLTASV